jgi:hypothetical protein
MSNEEEPKADKEAVPKGTDFGGLSKITNFSRRELKSLHNRFLSLCAPRTHLVSRTDFLQQPELVFCPLIARAYDIEAAEAGEVGITFETFVRILSPFSPKASNEEKKHCKIEQVPSLCLISENIRALIFCSDLKKLLGSRDGKAPSREDYRAFVDTIFSSRISREMVDTVVDEIWKTLSEDYSHQPFVPCSLCDLDTLMTIPY